MTSPPSSAAPTSATAPTRTPDLTPGHSRARAPEPAPELGALPTGLRCEIVGIGKNRLDYHLAWELQRTHHRQVLDGAADRVLLLEHPAVFTAGRRTQPQERPFDGTPVVEVDRGGKITFHGPGQLVGYPIVRLPHKVYVVDYVRRLEEALIRVCDDFGVPAARVPGRTGVWVAADARHVERKVAAIGVRVSGGVTMHGFSLNCDVDLGWFDRFVPCGIDDAAVTSLSAELGRTVAVPTVLDSVRTRLDELLSWQPYARTPDYLPPAEPPSRPSGPRVPMVGPTSQDR